MLYQTELQGPRPEAGFESATTRLQGEVTVTAATNRTHYTRVARLCKALIAVPKNEKAPHAAGPNPGGL